MPASLDVDPDVFATVGRAFLQANDAACEIVPDAATIANLAHGMAGVDSTGAAWARSYDTAAGGLLRAGAAVVDALGVLGDRITVSGTNHDDAETASVPRPGAAGPPVYPGQPGTGRAVSVVVSDPPTADGTPTDPPPGWWLIAHLLAWVWPAGHPDLLTAVGTGWLTASLKLSEQADTLTGPIADLRGQKSPEVPFALEACSGLQTTIRSLAEQYAIVAWVCTGYGNAIGRMHHDVVAELIELLATEAIIEAVGALASPPTGGVAQIPTQGVAGSQLSVAAARVGRILARLAEDVATLQNLVNGVGEQLASVLTELSQVNSDRDTLQAVTALIDAGIPPVDLQANDRENPTAHVIEKHVAKSKAYLIGRKIPVASTFTSLAAATTAVSTVLAAYASTIADWLRSTIPSKVLVGQLAPGLGWSYVRSSGTLITSTSIVVVLERNAHGYFIKTAYPDP